MHDLYKALKQYPVFLHLGWLDVKQRYRRSFLGPWWISLTMLIFISAMSFIFSQIFHQPLREYVPFFATGFILWSFISTQLNESTDVLQNNRDLIKQIQLPYTLYLMKLLTKNGIILGHNLVVYLLVMLWFQQSPGWPLFLFLPGMALVLINLYWISLLIALLSTRFRDLSPIVHSCMQVLFFVTPISWTSQLLGDKSWVIEYNPFAYLIHLTRAPLLGMVPSWTCWTINCLFALGGLSLSLLTFHRVRPYIPFWIE